VIGTYATAVVILELSTPPNVSSPELALLPVGWKKIPRVSEVMALLAKSESVMVGMDLLFSDNVPIVRSTGPIPKIPSTSSKPEDFVATPMDCCEILRLDDKVTVSMYSLPEKLPEPYVTDTVSPVFCEDFVGLYFKFGFAPIHVLELPVSIKSEYWVGGLPTPTEAV